MLSPLEPFAVFEPFRTRIPAGALAPAGFERLFVRTANGFEPFQVRKPDNSGWHDFQVRTNG
jgi:hypothetical protein